MIQNYTRNSNTNNIDYNNTLYLFTWLVIYGGQLCFTGSIAETASDGVRYCKATNSCGISAETWSV